MFLHQSIESPEAALADPEIHPVQAVELPPLERCWQPVL